jgi:UPF0042 nucleotide-binding protein
MRLIIVSGLSGSGKSVALAMLEDLDYYCVDNIPAGLLPGFIAYTVRTSEPAYRLTAVGVDARNRPEDLADVPRLVAELRRSGISCELLFLRAENEALIKRFSETRRRHPLSRDGIGLLEALEQEHRLLEPHALIPANQVAVRALHLAVVQLRRHARGPIGRWSVVVLRRAFGELAAISVPSSTSKPRKVMAREMSSADTPVRST